MKIKTDYVTNSSSSSFVAWGVDIDDIPFSETVLLMVYDGEVKRLEKEKVEAPEYFEKWCKSRYEELLRATTNEEKIELVEDLDFENKIAQLSSDGIFSFEESYVQSVGISPSSFIEHFPEVPAGKIVETVAEQINKTFGTEFQASDIRYIEEAWRDG